MWVASWRTVDIRRRRRQGGESIRYVRVMGGGARLQWVAAGALGAGLSGRGRSGRRVPCADEAGGGCRRCSGSVRYCAWRIAGCGLVW